MKKEEQTMTPILKLDDHDEQKEIEFELDYLLSLTTKQRFQMMHTKTQEIQNLLKDNGYRKAPQIIKRK
jgi:hypothetical protein